MIYMHAFRKELSESIKGGERDDSDSLTLLLTPIHRGIVSPLAPYLASHNYDAITIGMDERVM